MMAAIYCSFAHLTPGPLMGVNDLHRYVEQPILAEPGSSWAQRGRAPTATELP
ncbi:hypothetical protein OKW41_002808 [Paraburkholderia sp. UCT70]